MGMPIIVNGGWGAAEEIVKNSKCGIVLTSWDENEMIKAVTNLKSMTFSTTNIRQVASDCFSLEMGIKEYFKVYDRLSASL
jgi:glycosyltransferase involved in cell wall biosynthesis